jgi:hypothetical protein
MSGVYVSLIIAGPQDVGGGMGFDALYVGGLVGSSFTGAGNQMIPVGVSMGSLTASSIFFG